DGASVLSGTGHWRFGWWGVGEIAIKEFFPKRGAIAVFAFASAVIGDEEPDAGVGYEVKIAVKIDRIASVADDAMPIPRLLIKSKRHRIHGGNGNKLAGVHHFRSFGVEDPRGLEFNLLEVGADEVG